MSIAYKESIVNNLQNYHIAHLLIYIFLKLVYESTESMTSASAAASKASFSEL